MNNVKEFRLGDLFRKISVNKLDYKIGEMPKSATDKYNLPAIAAGFANQGVACYVPRQGATILKNCISVAANGDGYAFYQPDEFTIIQDAYAIEPIDYCLSEQVLLYIVAGIQKILDQKFGWTNKSVWNKVKDCKLALPFITILVPDWNQIADFPNNGGGAFELKQFDTSS